MKQKGFTLVELMIVVAVIGILSAIAIPNYLKMVARAKQTEARLNLGGIYSAEISYYGEASTFAGGADVFNVLGWDPTSPSVARYAYLIDVGMILPSINPPADLPAAIPVTNDSFTAQAAGNIDKDPYIDVWTMDDAKNLSNVGPDIER